MRWIIWRPILAKIATLDEIQNHWSIDDLADANEALDVEAELKDREFKKIKNKD